MAVEYLSASEKNLLLDLLFDATASFAATEKKFKEIFSPSRYHALTCELKTLCKDFIASVDGVALIMSIYLTDMMRRNDDFPAKVLFFDIFVELERAIRRDMFCAEKYKYSFKDSKDPKKSAEATYAEEYRIHLIVKVFAFRLLMGAVSADENASSYVSKKQEDIDSLLDTCDKSSLLIKEALADVAHCWASERDKRQCSTTQKCVTSFNQQLSERAVLSVSPITPKIASLPILTGELQLLFPEHTSMLVVDNSMTTVISDSIRKGTELRASKCMSKYFIKNIFFLGYSEEVLRLITLNTSLLVGIAEQNPIACAAILEGIPQPTLNFCIQSALNGSAHLENIEAVLLHVSNSLNQKSINIFIARRLKELSDKRLPSDSVIENVKKFISTLHGLLIKGPKESKDICIPESLKSEIEQLITFSHDSDISRMWEEIKG
ncbi:unnamed protein product [Phytomonas sp. EM1]|nr:unnamed protein product [Phytomonas sp. EM1]|eukprot:CCW63713.1 unnamed protein product [Phytomonas sp. isolate EM1]